MKKIIYVALAFFVLSSILVGTLPDTNPTKDIFGFIMLFASIILIGYYLFYIPIKFLIKWQNKHNEYKRIRKEEKKKEKMEKWLASDDGQEYIRTLDDIDSRLDSVNDDLDKIGDGIKKLEEDIKKD